MCRFDHSFNFASLRPAGRRLLSVLSGVPIFCLAIAGSAGTASAATPDQLDLPGGIVEHEPEADAVRVVINVPARRLRLVRGNELVRAYPVAIGRPDTPTPTGQFRILQKTVDPTWAPKGRKPVPPGPQNPLGHRWMRFSEDGYGIHATNEPGSIGRARSHGCIRMSRSDAEDLFERVTIGTPVEIVYELSGYDDEGEPALHDDVYRLATASTN